MTYHFNQFYIPDHMMDGLRRYIDHGIGPGDFLTAVICNDLSEAVGRADSVNQANLPAYVGYLYNEAPLGCWGSRENMEAWIETKMHERETEAIAAAAGKALEAAYPFGWRSVDTSVDSAP